MQSIKEEWTPAKLIKKRDNIISHIYVDAKKFIPSYEKANAEENMNWILGWEYGRLWLMERDNFVQARSAHNTPKFIKPNFEGWLEKHKRKGPQRLCGK